MSTPSDDYSAGYRRWLNTGTSVAALFETVEINHSSFGPLYYANWHAPVDRILNDQPGTPTVTFQPTRFFPSPESLEESTAQQASITMAHNAGLIYDYLRNMTMEERDDPIQITARSYLTNNLNMTVNPPPIWTVHSAAIKHDVISFDLRAEPLRVRRVGIYYTALEYPILSMLP